MHEHIPGGVGEAAVEVRHALHVEFLSRALWMFQPNIPVELRIQLRDLDILHFTPKLPYPRLE
jgi:hypothetical protein